MQLGDRISDVDHQVVAFDRRALEFVNLDAARSGGIRTLRKFK